MPNAEAPRAWGLLAPLLVGAVALCLAAPAAAGPVRSAPADPLREAIAGDLPALFTLYRALHAEPELAFAEHRTADRLAAELAGLGFAVTRGVGGTGVVGVLENGPGPVLMIRTDMDALPVREETGLPWASRREAVLPDGTRTPVMHACGHDLHMAIWVGTARRLSAMRAAWRGTLLFVAQPAEETGEGAAAMLADGLFERFPTPTHALALHGSAAHPTGVVAFTPGPAMAQVDSVDVTIRGIGGHGAAPALARNPILLAASTILAWQRLPAGGGDQQPGSVVSVGAIEGGSAHNVIGEEVRLKLTVRSLDPEARLRLLEDLRRTAEAEARAIGLPEDRLPLIEVRPSSTPVLINTPEFANRAASAIAMRLGRDRVVQVAPAMGGEDFGRYRLARPGLQSFLFWVGTVNRETFARLRGDPRRLSQLHSPRFAPDAAPAIAAGVEAMVAAALSVVGPELEIARIFPRGRPVPEPAGGAFAGAEGQ